MLSLLQTADSIIVFLFIQFKHLLIGSKKKNSTTITRAFFIAYQYASVNFQLRVIFMFAQV